MLQHFDDRLITFICGIDSIHKNCINKQNKNKIIIYHPFNYRLHSIVDPAN